MYKQQDRSTGQPAFFHDQWEWKYAAARGMQNEAVFHDVVDLNRLSLQLKYSPEKGVCYNKLGRSGPRFALSEDTTGDAADKAHYARTKQGIGVTLIFRHDQVDRADDQRHNA
jgi:hypothetical protein